MKSYYRTNSHALSFGECWRLTRSPVAVILWLSRFLGFKIGNITGQNKIDYWACEIEPESIPEEAREWVSGTCSALVEEGFGESFWFHRADAISRSEASGCVLRDQSGDCFALITYVKSSNVVPANVEKHVVFVTRRNDRTFVGTTNETHRLDSHPEDRNIYLNGASVARVLARHRAEMMILRERNDLVPFQSRHEMVEAVGENQDKEYAHMIQRRFFIELTDDEVAELHADLELRQGKLTGLEAFDSSTPIPEADNGDSSDEETHAILVELGKLQEKKQGWGNAVTVLVMTVAVFIGLGVTRWDIDLVLMLVPILLFHELGHLLAMRCFNYRDLKIFFIPLLGAAATGRNYNVEGWKKGVVFLMGPLPGIALGAVLGAVAIYYEHDWGLRFAQLMLILNGLNLLPILPLDGGQLVAVTLFARHPKWEIVFKVLTVVGAFVLYRVLDSWFFLILAFLPLMSMYYDYGIARVAREMRISGRIGNDPEEAMVSARSAKTILQALTTAFPKGLDHKTLAGFTLRVFEKANTTPPGLLASISLLVTYVGSILAAVVFLGLFAVGGDILRGDRFDDFIAAAELNYECGSVESWPPSASVAAGMGEHPVLSAVFEDDASLENGWELVSQELDGFGLARRVGPIILVSLDDANTAVRTGLFDRFEALGGLVAVQSTNGTYVSFSFSVAELDQAAEVENQLSDYFAASRFGDVIAPWFEGDNRTPEAVLRHQSARETLKRLEQAGSQGLEASEEKYQEIHEANRRGEYARATELGRALARERREQENEAIEAVRALGEPEVYLAVIESYQTVRKVWQDLEETDGDMDDAFEKRLAQANQEVASHLGLWTDTNWEGDVHPSWVQIQSGAVEREGEQLSVKAFGLQNTLFGIPSVLEWICQNGGHDIKFGIGAQSTFMGVGDD